LEHPDKIEPHARLHNYNLDNRRKKEGFCSQRDFDEGNSNQEDSGT